jgi:hypothetical protein
VPSVLRSDGKAAVRVKAVRTATRRALGVEVRIRAGVGVRRRGSTAGALLAVVFRADRTSSIEESEWKEVEVETTMTGPVGMGSAHSTGTGAAATAWRASIAASGLYGAGNLGVSRSGRGDAAGCPSVGVRRRRSTILSGLNVKRREGATEGKEEENMVIEGEHAERWGCRGCEKVVRVLRDVGRRGGPYVARCWAAAPTATIEKRERWSWSNLRSWL